MTKELIGGCVCDKLFNADFQTERRFVQMTSSVYCVLANSYLSMEGLIGKRCLQLAVCMLDIEDVIT